MVIQLTSAVLGWCRDFKFRLFFLIRIFPLSVCEFEFRWPSCHVLVSPYFNFLPFSCPALEDPRPHETQREPAAAAADNAAPVVLPPSPSRLTLDGLKAELENTKKYPIADSEGLSQRLLADFVGMTYADAARLLAAQGNVRLRAVGLWAAGRCCHKKGDKMELDDGRKLNEREL